LLLLCFRDDQEWIIDGHGFPQTGEAFGSVQHQYLRAARQEGQLSSKLPPKLWLAAQASSYGFSDIQSREFSELADCAEFSSILLRLAVLYDGGSSDSGNHKRAFPNTSPSNGRIRWVPTL
jgi:hypothetical protein